MNTLRTLEQTVLAEGREWTRERLEKQLPAQSDALPARCPQSGTPPRDTRWRDLQLHTLAGVVRLRVRHGYSAALARWVCPARAAWGLAAHQRRSRNSPPGWPTPPPRPAPTNAPRAEPTTGATPPATAAGTTSCQTLKSDN